MGPTTNANVPPIFPEEAVSSWGYRTIGTGVFEQSDWEIENFGRAEVRNQCIKGIEELKDWENAYYRFRISEEVFETSAQARKRVDKVGDAPPGQHTKAYPEWTLCDGRWSGRTAIIVSTDSTKFKEEALPDLIAKIEAYLAATASDGKDEDGQPDTHREPR